MKSSKKSVRNGELFENWWRIYTGLLCIACACVCVRLHVSKYSTYYVCIVTANLALGSLSFTFYSMPNVWMCECVGAQMYTWMEFHAFVFVEFKERKTRATPKIWEKVKWNRTRTQEPGDNSNAWFTCYHRHHPFWPKRNKRNESSSEQAMERAQLYRSVSVRVWTEIFLPLSLLLLNLQLLLDANLHQHPVWL